MKHQNIHRAAIVGLFVVLLSLPARAAVYSFNYTDSGAIPQHGDTPATIAFEQTVSGIASSITSIELVLTFNDSTSLTGTSAGIQGHLNLGTGTSAPFVNFYPTGTQNSSGQYVYDVTFSGTSGSPGTGFSGLNPNTTWGLVLWDNTTASPSDPFRNGLAGWSLDITAVPEPLNVALGLFGVVVAAAGGTRWYLSHRKLHRRAYVWPV